MGWISEELVMKMGYG